MNTGFEIDRTTQSTKIPLAIVETLDEAGLVSRAIATRGGWVGQMELTRVSHTAWRLQVMSHGDAPVDTDIRVVWTGHLIDVIERYGVPKGSES